MYKDNWRRFFAKESFRTNQDWAADRIATHLDNGVRAVAAELPTGIGKSYIALALAKVPESSYVVTSQNILIDQYESDFGSDPDFATIKGKQNYKCRDHAFSNCKEGSSSKSKYRCYDFKTHNKGGCCTYRKAKDTAMASKVCFTNSTYYALACQSEEWNRRALTIFDEAHNLPKDIMSLTEIKISEYELNKLRIAKTLPFTTEIVSIDEFCDYIYDLKDELEFVADSIEKGHELHVDKDDLTDLLFRISTFLTSVDSGVEWIVDYLKSGDRHCVIAKPIDTAYFAENMFFKNVDQIVLQSATIVNPKQFAAELGLTGQGVFITADSPFPLNRRPIIRKNIGHMNQANIKSTMPKLINSIRDILDKHENEKGIVHTHSNAIFKALKEEFMFNGRCLFPDSSEKSDQWNYHKNSSEPTVIFSPSLTEGIDGYGDLARFQVICKIPYPSLGDRRIKIKADRDFEWYQYQTAKTLIQTIGRGMRYEDDWCKNYVLDSGFDSFVDRAKLPRSITSTIV